MAFLSPARRSGSGGAIPGCTGENFSWNSTRFDAALLPDELIVDRRRPGDRILPFGRTTELSLKKLRIDRKLPFDYPCPVLREPSGRILWAPGIRHSACAPLSAATTQAVEFRLRRTDGTPLSPEVSA